MNFTPDQQKVIDLRNKNILVSAAAGSGKTAVLTERIAELVCGPDADMGKYPVNPEDDQRKQIDRILIVTFTKAAAREMRERIGKRLRERLEKRPSDSHIRRQILLLSTAHITTIDSFCQYILRNHFEDIGLDPSFKIANDTDKKMILDAAFDETVAVFLEEDSKSFKHLLECYAPKGRTANLRNMVFDLNYKAGSKPYPYEWLKSLAKDKITNLDESPFVKYLFEYENNYIDMALRYEEAAVNLASGTRFDKALSIASEEYSFLMCVRDKERFNERNEALRNFQKSRLSSPTKMTPEEALLKEEIYKYVNMARDVIELLVSYHKTDADAVLKHVNESIETADALIEFEIRFLQTFDRMKREANVIDFTDMEHLALEILVRKENGEILPTDTALSYRSYFDEIMIDEYQDSNDVQETILGVIAKVGNEGNRFMVGDVKQSIYGFRMAKPEIFEDKYDRYSFDKNERDVKVCLSSNFRSRREVIDSVNAIFSQTMKKKIGGIDYTDEHKLIYGKTDYPEAGSNYKTELLYFDKDDKGDEDPIVVEARLVGNKINEMINSQMKVIRNAKTMEPVPLQYKDIVILLQAAEGRDVIYKEELRKKNIPAYVISKTGYYSVPEVRLILNMLTVIDNPRQDMPLLSVLHSIIGKFTEEEIAIIRIDDRKNRLYESVRRYSLSGDNLKIKDKCERFLEKLEIYRGEAAYRTASEMIDEIYKDFDYLARSQSLPNGEQRFANVKLLLDTAEELEEQGLFGLHDFVKAMEDMTKKEVDTGEANILDENADVVKIMTIHKSKGLEYPVCFVSSFGKQFHSSAETAMTDDEFGIGVDAFNVDKRTQNPSLLKKVIGIKTDMELKGEELRVLYVALTRAREKLIMTAFYNDEDKLGSDKTEIGNVVGAKSFMDIVAPIAKVESGLFEMRHVSSNELSAGECESITEDRNMRIQRLLNAESDKSFEPFAYPHPSLEGLFTKTTVSELKKAAYLEREDGENTLYHDEEKKIPKFIAEEENEIGGARRGTAYHRVMELADFTGIYDGDLEANLIKRRKECVESLFISSEDDKLVSKRKLLKFFDTELARRMSAAAKKGNLYLEQPFVLSVDADKVRDNLPKDEKILVQGVIDVYFEEDGELVLMDYKTDRVDSGDELIRRYKTQLDYYAQALSRLEKKPVKEIFIYSFALDEVILV